MEIDFAAIYPPVHAFWKLKPPVTASIFKISPAKYKVGYNLLSKLLKLISFKSTPPAVTNYSLKVLFPSTLKIAVVNCKLKLSNCCLFTSAHVVASKISEAFTNSCHKRFGN